MSARKHVGNDQDLVMKQYKTVSSLKNINELADRIEIDYNKLDTITRGDLKETIANVLHGFKNLDNLPEETKKYVDDLIKQNMTYKIDIDYSKIDNEELLTAFILKKKIQQTLEDRKHAIYTNMTLNANY